MTIKENIFFLFMIICLTRCGDNGIYYDAKEQVLKPSRFSRFTNLYIRNLTDSSSCMYRAHFGKGYRYFLLDDKKNLSDYFLINCSKGFRIKPNNRYLINNRVEPDATDLYCTLEVNSLGECKLSDFDKRQLYYRYKLAAFW